MSLRQIASVALLLTAIACVVGAAFAWASPLIALVLIGAGCYIAGKAYAVDHAPARSRRRASGYTMIELLVVIGIIAAIMGIAWPAITAWRSSTQSVVDEKLREVAVEKMYEDRGITGDEIYAACAKAEWSRRGWTVPTADPANPSLPWEWTARHVTAQIDVMFPTTPPEPAFTVPSRTSRQALIDQGLPEPEAKKELGMQ